MKFSQLLIDKVKAGELAIQNDGSVEDLRLLVREIWPLCEGLAGLSKFYFQDSKNYRHWNYADHTNIPFRSVKEFIALQSESQGALRSYKLTRQDMKSLWMARDEADKKKLLEYVHNTFPAFENEITVDDNWITVFMNLFPGVNKETIKSIFPEHFRIPEGEPVLFRNHLDRPWQIGVSSGDGGVYIGSTLYGTSYVYTHIIPFTKNPPK